ncbi:GGDEF domain-containing protein [Oleiagrimonas citrea]|uniref:diguanylate cyclase n=1 Tax=Oleiagrimonas citrea TaxID=1665687 RepID=A0A846ZNM4_9GAMM|nr:GGDEF domain-containing protein [Oleiagrimonas citrea]NKZ39432.1 GGDEF domain-containing protein [Oleiagrimonas citrea]
MFIAAFSIAFMPAMTSAHAPVGTQSEPAPASTTSHALLQRADEIKTKNHAEFLRTLELLHQRESSLSDDQRWKLRYFDAWQIAFDGNYRESNKALHKIISDSTDPSVAARASALLIYTLNAGQHYEASYKLASRLVTELPEIRDSNTRIVILVQVSQMLALAGQYELALKYARQIEDALPPGASKCKALTLEASTQIEGHTLQSSSPALNQAIDSCLKAKQIVYANVLRIDKANLLIEEGHPDSAIALLEQLAPSARKSGYQRHVVEYHVLLAKAYLKKNDDVRARRYALETLSLEHAENFEEDIIEAYHILYLVNKKTGRQADALTYYEKYVALDQASTQKAKARALAYQMVKQEVLAKKTRVDALSKQNRILQLRHALDSKQAETNRLYVLILLLLLAGIGFLLYKIKHSQLRFRRMAREDDLTGAFTRQHFFEQAEHVLRRMQKNDNEACLMILDMDHFKRVNDMYGHITGDSVLKHATSICMRELRSSDVFGRLGGEEFGVLMPGCTPQQGKEIGDRMRRALMNSPVRVLENESLTITASIGLASTRTSGYQLMRMMLHADEALYEAKRNGRNQLMISSGNTATAMA